MGREVRRVSPDWVHPKSSNGRYVPLHEHSSLCTIAFVLFSVLVLYRGPEYCMPDFGDAATHFMMYEDTSEGTPISPAFGTAEELARWLTDNNASSFAGMTADYDAWLSVCNGGWAPSMVLIPGHGLMSGVEFNKGKV